jgi:ABC-type nitrate/sulfonate/bicarbonate transport system substrate-binding protein
MTPTQLLTDLEAAGATVTADSAGLRVEAPPDVLAARRQAITEHRDALLALVASRVPDGASNPVPADVEVDEHVARVLSLTPEDRTAWRREVIHAAVWAAAGKRNDPHLLADLRVLRRMEAAGACLRCGETSPPDGRFWCDGCASRYANATEAIQ